jgi:hypothetical protein
MSSIQYCSLNGKSMMLNRPDKSIIYCSWSSFQSGRPTRDSMLVVFDEVIQNFRLTYKKKEIIIFTG